MSTHAAAIDRQLLADGLLRCGPWYCTTDDGALVSHAEAQARHVAREASSLGDDVVLAYQRAARRVERHQLDAPTGYGHRGGLARMSCPMWWRRQLRRLNARRLEQRERVLGRVHVRAGVYVSHQGLAQRRAQQRRNSHAMQEVFATNQHGQEYSLAELAELGLANPDNRRAELMVRLNQTTEEAERLGHVAVFYTITCPSRFHPVVKNKGAPYPNPSYDGSTPRDAQAYLQGVWSRARAKLKRDGLGIYGLRTAEPHHDGCPHWHLLLFMRPEDRGEITRILESYACEADPGEIARRPGDSDAAAEKRRESRFQPIIMDPAKGSAAAYIAKYISKNINGEQFAGSSRYGTQLDKNGYHMDTAAPRVEAWAATWGIRQFQFVGLPSVSVWRELRRLSEQQVASWEAITHGGRLRFMDWPGRMLRPAPLGPLSAVDLDDWRELLSDPELLALGQPFHFVRHGQRQPRPAPLMPMVGDEWRQAIARIEASATMHGLRHAANAGRWDEFVRLMGGPMTKRDEQAARPWRVQRASDADSLDRDTGEIDRIARGRYGEPVAATWGLVVTSATGQAEYLTRLYRWEIEHKPSGDGFDLEGLTFDGSAVARTGVNNCTPPDAAPPRSPQQIFEPWELNAAYWYRRMNPAPDPENVRRLRLQIEHDAEQYRQASAERIAAAQAERHRLQSIRQGEDIIRQWLAAGEISMQEAAEVLTA
ncbi:hypothetical protein BTW10_09990 [Chromohalobacter japonicus]|uniref:Replication gene A protein-like domain-containing protein n=1 Tax=Chromohalobacter japonicus TaxID=223900 RepID=A0A1Q8TCI1_9GAMM|nr:replication endonuclease [Chromohalobacter japonicus]OLO11409.1 hypothetical protein BTW10_09990 [Chromohalobacter japonicus]